MKYNLEINGETAALSASQHEDGVLTIQTAVKDYRVACRRIDRHHLALVVDGVPISVFVSGGERAKQIWVNGNAYRVRDADKQTSLGASGRTASEPPRDVTPPMPSVVVTILVAEGQHVTRGDKLVVVSAMKMETTLAAPFDARVRRINVVAGDKVMPGDILVDLEAGAK